MPASEAKKNWSTLAFLRIYFLTFHTSSTPGGSSVPLVLASCLELFHTHPCTPHINAHNPPKTLWIFLHLLPVGARRSCQSLISVSLFESEGGVEAKLKTCGTFHLRGQPGKREGQIFVKGKSLLKHLVSVWQQRSAITGQHDRLCGCVCFLYIHTLLVSG